MNISLLCFVGAGLCLIAAALVEGFAPLLMNTTEDKRGIHILTCAILITAGFLIYGGFDAAN